MSMVETMTVVVLGLVLVVAAAAETRQKYLRHRKPAHQILQQK
jgi:hypothetical protein